MSSTQAQFVDNMSYSRSKQSTEKEKKLQHLRLQLYGQEHPLTSSYSLPKASSSAVPTVHITPALTSTHTLPENFLRTDLLKSFFLASLAISAQLLLYFLLQRGLLRF